jgi:predicted DNA-binding transcriptional regulator AlpA
MGKVAAEPRGLRRDAAAGYVGISPTKFDELVADGRMPKPFTVDSCVIWDRWALDRAIDELSSGARVMGWTKRAG